MYSRSKKDTPTTKEVLMKWVKFEGAKLIFEVFSVSLAETRLLTGSRSFQRGAMGSCRSKECKVTSCQR